VQSQQAALAADEQEVMMPPVSPRLLDLQWYHLPQWYYYCCPNPMRVSTTKPATPQRDTAAVPPEYYFPTTNAMLVRRANYEGDPPSCHEGWEEFCKRSIQTE
jgi:hypothetical protein